KFFDSNVARLLYILIDDTGKLDLSNMVSSDTPEDNTQVRQFDRASDISLLNLISGSDTITDFNHNGQSGDMPSGGWTSLFNAMQTGAISTVKDTIIRNFIPFSVSDPEEYAIDSSTADSALATGTDSFLVYERFNLNTATVSDIDSIYQTLIGPGSSNGTDSNLWSPWLKGRASSVYEARLLAARMTVNIIDYMDSSDSPTVGFINMTDGVLTLDTGDMTTIGTRAAGTDSIVYGVDNYYGLSELLFRVTSTNDTPNVNYTLHVQTKVHSSFSAVDDNDFRIAIAYVLTGEDDAGTSKAVASTYVYDPSTIATPARTSASTYERIYYDAAADSIGDTIVVGNFSDLIISSAGSSHKITSLRICKIIVEHKSNIVQVYPAQPQLQDIPGVWPTPPPPYTTVLWENSDAATSADKSYTLKITFKDPLFAPEDIISSPSNPSITADPISSPTSWSATSPTLDETNAEPYNLTKYSGIRLSGAGLVTIGELGRIHSASEYNQSAKLWLQSASDTAFDGRLLDLFSTSDTAFPGRININTRKRGVLMALVTQSDGDEIEADGVEIDDDDFADLMLAYTTTPLFYRGDVGHIFKDYTDEPLNSTTHELAVEGWINQIANLISTRQNYYTLVVTAQSLQDLSPLPGANQFAINPDKVIKYRGSSIEKYTKIVSENKVKIFFYRDAWTNRIKVLLYEKIED
ncbi:MAG: hypothetical protein HRT89_06730, partial [Lentisphaeria bacterium]|nr:hypothetical protein [Lentisphaeria bacterium]